MRLKLYNFHRSSACFRVRIGLALKNLDYEVVTVNLRSGQQRSKEFLAHSPAALVPQLVHGTNVLNQSLAILEYLDSVQPEPALIPKEPASRARAWEFALAIACDIHPLNNLRVLGYLRETLGVEDTAGTAWYANWIASGFATLEKMLEHGGKSGPFCLGECISIADVCLVPQMANARRFEVALDAYPRIVAVDAHCRTLPAVMAADRPAADDPAYNATR